jgi:hypothetical protein
VSTEPEPSGAAGRDTGNRDARGRFAPGNGAALVVGARSLAFWVAADDARREIRDAVIADAGFAVEDAPRALIVAADGLAQAALLRDASFARVVESRGPLTSTGRTRRAFAVWQAAADRAERYMRLVGLRRQPKPAPTLAELLAAEPADDAPDADAELESADEPNAPTRRADAPETAS